MQVLLRLMNSLQCGEFTHVKKEPFVEGNDVKITLGKDIKNKKTVTAVFFLEQLIISIFGGNMKK